MIPLRNARKRTPKVCLSRKESIKKGASAAPSCTYVCNDLELVNQTQRYDIIGANTRLAGEVVVIQQVDFVVNVGRHVFVEVVSRANVDVLQQILVAVVNETVVYVFAFRLQVSDGRTQAEVPKRVAL